MKKIIYFIGVLIFIGLFYVVASEEGTQPEPNVDAVDNTTEESDPIIEDNSVVVISFDELYDLASEAAASSSKLEGTEKINFITSKVSEDIISTIDENIILEALNYVITEYENEKFKLNSPANLYITRLLDKQLDQYPELQEADSMVFDMFQICKDIIRLNSENMEETKQSISANEYQIDKVLESVKLNLK